MMSSGESLFGAVVPVYIRTGGYTTAGSQMGAPCATPTDLGRRSDTTQVDLHSTTSINGRRVREKDAVPDNNMIASGGEDI